MKIYKDIISGDEMLNDTYDLTLVDGVAYQLIAKHITMNAVGEVNTGANPSAEGDDAVDVDVSADCVSGLDLVLHMRLTETAFGQKKDYLTYLKGYMKEITEKLEKEHPEEVETFKTGINGFIKKKLANFKDMQFFQGESMNPDGMTALLIYEDIEGTEQPVFYFFKHGLMAEKV